MKFQKPFFKLEIFTSPQNPSMKPESLKMNPVIIQINEEFKDEQFN
jgi:hypothetical protein